MTDLGADAKRQSGGEARRAVAVVMQFKVTDDDSHQTIRSTSNINETQLATVGVEDPREAGRFERGDHRKDRGSRDRRRFVSWDAGGHEGRA